jgi:hypothetical protein
MWLNAKSALGGKESKGKANPQVAEEFLRKKL